LGEQEDLRASPHPTFFLECPRQLAIAPPEGAVFEDALAGVVAGRAVGFGCVVGVDCVGQAGELRRHGADIVVSDLGRSPGQPVTLLDRNRQSAATDVGRAPRLLGIGSAAAVAISTATSQPGERKGWDDIDPSRRAD
jgi:hypothetical protein